MAKNKILIVDDERWYWEALFDRMEFEDRSYLYAESCSEALDILKNEGDEIEITILDCMLPIGEDKNFIEFQAIHSKNFVGETLAKYIAISYPTVKIIGYSVSNEEKVRKTFEDIGGTFVHKLSEDSFAELFKLINHISTNKSLPKKLPQIFIVHGHAAEIRLELKNYLQNTLRLGEPVILDEQPNIGKAVIEKFEHYSKNTNLVFVLLTPDDLVKVIENGAEYMQPRANVLFELGFFYSKLKRESGAIILLSKSQVKLPSDISGIIYIDISNGINSAGEIIRRELRRWL